MSLKRFAKHFIKPALFSSPLALFIFLSATVPATTACNAELSGPECPTSDSAWNATSQVPAGCCPVTDSAWANVKYAHVSCCVYHPLKCKIDSNLTGVGSSSLMIVSIPGREEQIVLENRGGHVYYRVNQDIARFLMSERK